MKFLTVILTFLILSPSIKAHALEPRNQESMAIAIKHGFKITMVDGKPLEIKWPDGRVASSFSRGSPISTIEFPLFVTENLCVKTSPKVTCSYKMDLRIENLEMRWTKNKDPKRLGEVVLMSKTNKLSSQVAWFSPIKKLAPTSTMGLKDDQLSCENWQWLPFTQGTEVPEKIVMSSLDGDFMGTNIVTGAAVNLGFSGYHNLVWEKIGTSLELKSVGQHYAAGSGFFPPFFGFIMSATIENPIATDPINRFCQVTLRTDVSSLTKQAIALSNKGNPVPYNLGTDDLFSAIDVGTNFMSDILRLGTENNVNGKNEFTLTEVY
jgi:hypothetical protein